jgi:hypothetical protein
MADRPRKAEISDRGLVWWITAERSYGNIAIRRRPKSSFLEALPYAGVSPRHHGDASQRKQASGRLDCSS